VNFQDDALLPGVLREAFASKTVVDNNGVVRPLESNVSLREALILASAVSSLAPETTAEVGFAQGISATAITHALFGLHRGVHHVMDPFQERFHDAGLSMIRRAGLEANFCFHRKFAEDVFPNLPLLQFVFIDASHLFDFTLAEFVLADKRLALGGMIAFHDLWMPSQQKLLRFILANRSYTVVRDFDPPPAPPARLSLKRRVIESLRGVARRAPGRERFFKEEFLRPWAGFQIANLVLLRKTAQDSREWTYHKEF
jgi:hypothetical protein